MLSALGLLGGFLLFISHVPYVRDILKGKTKPHRVTWGVLFLLNLVFIANHLDAGATTTMWLVYGSTLATLIVFLLSFKLGVGGTSKLDIIAVAIIIGGVILWQVLDNPTVSIVANLLIGALGAIPTIKKAYLKPETETTSKWVLGAIGGLLAAISVGELDFTLLLLPVAIVLFQGTVSIILLTRSPTEQSSS